MMTAAGLYRTLVVMVLLITAALCYASYQLGRDQQAKEDDHALWVLDSLNAQAPTVDREQPVPDTNPDTRRNL